MRFTFALAALIAATQAVELTAEGSCPSCSLRKSKRSSKSSRSSRPAKLELDLDNDFEFEMPDFQKDITPVEDMEFEFKPLFDEDSLEALLPKFLALSSELALKLTESIDGVEQAKQDKIEDLDLEDEFELDADFTELDVEKLFKSGPFSEIDTEKLGQFEEISLDKEGRFNVDLEELDFDLDLENDESLKAGFEAGRFDEIDLEKLIKAGRIQEIDLDELQNDEGLKAGFAGRFDVDIDELDFDLDLENDDSLKASFAGRFDELDLEKLVMAGLDLDKLAKLEEAERFDEIDVEALVKAGRFDSIDLAKLQNDDSLKASFAKELDLDLDENLGRFDRFDMDEEVDFQKNGFGGASNDFDAEVIKAMGKINDIAEVDEADGIWVRKGENGVTHMCLPNELEGCVLKFDLDLENGVLELKQVPKEDEDEDEDEDDESEDEE